MTESKKFIEYWKNPHDPQDGMHFSNVEKLSEIAFLEGEIKMLYSIIEFPVTKDDYKLLLLSKKERLHLLIKDVKKYYEKP